MKSDDKEIGGMNKKMQVNYYRIINKILEVRGEREIPLFYEFKVENPEQESDIFIEFYEQEYYFHQWYGVDYCCAEKEYPHLFLSHGESGVRMMADAEYKHLIIEGVQKSLSGAMELLLTGFYSWLSRRGYLLTHASLIEYQGETVMFSASSGVGKTTQAELWKKFKGAEILNGDKVVLEGNDINLNYTQNLDVLKGKGTNQKQVVAWGSPWRGSSPYAQNRCAELKGIILLEQGQKNQIRKLGREESIAKFFPHVFYPSWDKKSVDGMMFVLEQVLEQVPIYSLICKPDEEAVQITYEAVWKQ